MAQHREHSCAPGRYPSGLSPATLSDLLPDDDEQRAPTPAITAPRGGRQAPLADDQHQDEMQRFFEQAAPAASQDLLAAPPFHTAAPGLLVASRFSVQFDAGGSRRLWYVGEVTDRTACSRLDPDRDEPVVPRSALKLAPKVWMSSGNSRKYSAEAP